MTRSMYSDTVHLITLILRAIALSTFRALKVQGVEKRLKGIAIFHPELEDSWKVIYNKRMSS